MLFRIERVSKEFGTQVLFRGISAQCNPGDRIGLIGRNGAGKTTLFDLVQGTLEPDEGRVHRASGLSVARINQIPSFRPDSSVRQEALRVFEHLQAAESRLQDLAAQIAASHSIDSKLSDEYESLSLRMKLHGGYDYEARTEAVLLGIGFSKDLLDAPWTQLSGGQKNRLLAAQALLTPADLVLLDEPTNHLDIQAILWLTDYLASLKSAYLVISHDRRFLDQVTTSTWEVESKRLHAYPGGFSQARGLREQRLLQERQAYERQQEWKEKTEDFVRRNIVGQKTKQAQSRRKQLEKTEWLEAPQEDRSAMHLRIAEGRRGGALSFQLRDARIGYPGKTLLDEVDLSVRRGERIGIVGGNGSGKSTLLNCLAGTQPLLGGELEWGPNNDLTYFSQNPTLGRGKTVYDSLREADASCTDEELRSYAALFLFKGDDIFKPLEALSGGERSRLALARLIYEPTNVLLMDEPTNHLDISSRESLEQVLKNFRGALLVVSHDLFFLEEVVDRFYWIRDGRLHAIDDLNSLRFQELPQRSAAPAKPARSNDRARDKPKASKNRLRKLREQLEELEERVASLESRKSLLEDSLQNPDNPFERLQELTREHQTLEEELSQLYWQWEERAEELSLLEA